MQETWVQPLGQEDPLEEGVVTCSSILARQIPWTEEPGGLQSTGLQSRTLKWLSTPPWYIERGQQFYLRSHYHHKYQHSEKGTYHLSIITKTAFPSHTSWKRSLQATPWEPLNKLLGARIYVVTISYLFPLPGNAFRLLPAVPNSDIPSSKLSLIFLFPIWVALYLFCLTHI